MNIIISLILIRILCYNFISWIFIYIQIFICCSFFNIAAQELPARPSNNRKAGASLPVSAAALCKQLPDRTLPAPGAGITNKRMPGVRPDILRSNNVPTPGN